MGADTDAKTAASEDFKKQFGEALNIGFWEMTQASLLNPIDGDMGAVSHIISNRTPEQLVNAFEEVRPEWKVALDEIRQDPALLKSLHNAISKDPTLLEEFGNIVSDAGTANPTEFAQSLKDPKTRKALTLAFDKIAEEDKFTGKDFRELYDNRNDQAKTLAKLKDMGINPTDMMDMQMGMQMLVDFLRDPVGFLKQLPDMLEQMGVMGPMQAEAWKNSPAMEFAQGYAGIVLGPSTDHPGYGPLLANGIEKATRYYESGDMQKDIDVYSGEADKQVAAGLKPASAYSTGVKVTLNSTKPSELMGDNNNVQTASARDTFNVNSFAERTDGYKAPEEPRQVADLRGGAYVVSDKIAAGPSMMG